MKKNDIRLLAAVLALAGILGIVGYFLQRSEADYVQITLDGEVCGQYELSEDREVLIDTAYGHNRVVIENGAVFMSEADCPDKICVEHGRVTGPADLIVCLPHRLVVEIVSEKKENQVDGVAK